MVRYERRVNPGYFPNKLADHVKMCQTLKHSESVLIEFYKCISDCCR